MKPIFVFYIPTKTMTATLVQPTTTISDFDAWCDFILDGIDQLPDNGDTQQALADDKE